MSWTTKTAMAALAVALAAGAATSGNAAIIVTMVESGGDVVATGSGTANLAGLTLFSSPTAVLFGKNASAGVLILGPGPAQGLASVYKGIIGPASFGVSGSDLASSGLGDVMGVSFSGVDDTLLLPVGYVSGAALSASLTFSGDTLASLGVTPGTYVWNWGSGSDADSFTLSIGNVTAIPLPSALSLLALPLAGLFLSRRRGT